MIRVARYLLAFYAGAVLMSKGLERNGLLRCGCPGDCWCHRPGLSVFRWTSPIGHGGAG